MTIRSRALLLAALLMVTAACGSSAHGSSSSTTTTAGGSRASGGGPASTVAPSSAERSFCPIVRATLNRPGFDPASKPPAVKEYFAADLAALRTAVSRAPRAIKADLKLVMSVVEQEIAVLAKAGYDLTKVDPAAFANFSTPALKAASVRVDAYVSKLCGIDATGTSTP